MSVAEQAVSGATLTTNQTTYSAGQGIVATWTGLPGNATDWISVAPAGSDLMTTTRWTYVNGVTDGNYTFTNIGNGTFVVRAFSNDSYDLVVESDPFTVGSSSSVTTDASAYVPGQAIDATWVGLPGNQFDWVAIAPPGSSPQTITNWVYTNGATSGSHLFNEPIGMYVARAFLDDGYTVLAESAPFSVSVSANATIGTDKTSYTFDDSTITITYSGMPGGSTDWIATAVSGSPETSVLRWAYTGGHAAGSVVLTTPTDVGTYVARGYTNDSFVEVGESLSFSIQVGITTDASSYVTEQRIGVTWGTLPSNTGGLTFTLGYALAGSPISEAQHMAGLTSNPFPIGPSVVGTYVIRMFRGDTLVGESSPFTVTSGAPTLTTDTSVAVNHFVGVSFTNMPTNTTNNWIGIAPVGAPVTSVLHWAYVTGSNGQLLLQSPATAGSYVARAFVNDSYTQVGESPPFTAYVP